MKTMPKVCSFNQLELTVLTEEGEEKKVQIPVATFFQATGQIGYLAAAHKKDITPHTIGTAITPYGAKSTNEMHIKSIFKYHLENVGEPCVCVKEAVHYDNGVKRDAISDAVEKIRAYKWN